MANKHFADLPTAGPLTGTEVAPLDQGGATVQTTTQAIANLAPLQDHNALTNLTAGDAHPHYLNQTRGDQRYPLITRILTAGNGLSGGGDLSANRSFTVVGNNAQGIKVTANGVELDLLSTGLLPEAVDAANDRVPIYNVSEGRPRLVSPATLLAGASGFVTTGRQIASGAGLTGGGDLSVDRTLAVGAGTGITVNADDVALNLAHAANVDHSVVSINTTTGLTGGGNITASRTLSLDTTHSRNVDHAAVSITGTNSIAGGGDISASRTLALVNDQATPAPFSFYSTNSGSVKGWQTLSFVSISGTIGNGQVPVAAVTQHQASLSIAWGQITGTKNADQLQGIAASSFVQVNTAPQLSALGVGTAAGTTGSIRATGDITAFFSSDIRWKKNVKPIPNALAKMRELRGVEFDWTDDFLETHGTGSEYFDQQHDVGVIAQELQKVLPEVVRTRNDGSLAVKYDRITPLLIQAIKELMDEVAELKDRLNGTT